VLRKKGKPDPTPARAEKRLASLFYQLKSRHALTGVYLKSTDNRPDDHCWWCDPENISGTHQTRGHLFKHCYTVCFLSGLQNVYFPWCGLLLFSHVLSPWCSHSALNLSAEGGGGVAIEPDLRAGTADRN